MADIDAAVRFARSGADGGDDDGIRTRRRTVQARSPDQRIYLAALAERDMVFALARLAAARLTSRSPWACRC
jgi:phosphate starvation-inducible PhoH-like protein